MNFWTLMLSLGIKFVTNYLAAHKGNAQSIPILHRRRIGHALAEFGELQRLADEKSIASAHDPHVDAEAQEELRAMGTFNGK